MKKFFPLLALVGLFPLHAQELELPNPGFEDGLVGWRALVSGGKRMNSTSPEAAHTGEAGLQVVDQSAGAGSELFSARLPAKAERHYDLRFWARYAEGSGTTVYLLFYGEDRKEIRLKNRSGWNYLRIPPNTEWQDYNLACVSPSGTAFIGIRVHSSVAEKCVIHLDDFVLSDLGGN